MIKRSSRLRIVNDLAEDILIKLLSTVVRDHKGKVVCFSEDAIDVYNKCFDEYSEMLARNKFLTTKEKEKLLNKFLVVEKNLSYLKKLLKRCL